MPNWCTNQVTVVGDDCVNFTQNLFGKDFSFNKIIPEPQTPEECDERYIIRSAEDARAHHLSYEGDKKWFNWYDWHRDNWGTKWDLCDDDLSIDGNTAQFLTAWNPPIPVFVKLSKMYPQYEFRVRYIDEGGSFDDTCTFIGGKCFYSESNLEEDDDD